MADTTWVDGFQRAVLGYLIKHDLDYSLGVYDARPTPLAAHVLACGVKEIHEVDEDSEEIGVVDSFDSTAHRHAVFVSVEFACNCGEYPNARIAREDTLAAIIWGVTHPINI